MTTLEGSRRDASGLLATASLGDLIAGLQTDPTLEFHKRRDACSAVRTVARAMGRRPEELPADPRILRDRLRDITPAQAGVSPSTWRNTTSLVGFALRHGGVDCMPGRSRDPLSPAWSALRETCGDKALWTGVSRFSRWCTERLIEPGDVTEKLFDTFLADLTARLLVKSPAITHRTTCRSWNEAGGKVPGWPAARAVLADNRRTYIMPWETFPASLKAQFDAYVQQRSEAGPLTERRSAPLRATTINTLTYQFRQFLAVRVRLGHDPQGLRTIADVLEPDAVKGGLEEFLKGKAVTNTYQAHGIAAMLRGLARWSGADERVLKPLRLYCRLLEPKRGMPAKTRERILQLEDPKAMRALAQLPQKIFDRTARRLKPYRRAVEVQTALMVEILLMVPLRVGNLAALDLDRHLSRFGKNRPYYISIPAEEVKNSFDLRFPLPAETSRLIDIYISKYRPILLDGPSSALFPGRGGGSKCVRSVSGNITALLKRELGLAFNVHAFRHLAAYTFLKANPGAYEIVRRLLGHKNIATTIAYYCGLENDAAMRHFADTVLANRRDIEGAASRGKRK